MKLELKHLEESNNYKVSDCGRIFSEKRRGSKGGELSQFIVKGYSRVSIWVDGKMKVKQVHRAVAETYIDNTLNKPQVNHIDGDKLNNNVSNLEWCTAKENSQHSHDLGLSKVSHSEETKQKISISNTGNAYAKKNKNGK